jgi:hypothetical protein
VLLQTSQCSPTSDGPVTARVSILPVVSSRGTGGGDLLAARRSPPPRPHLRSGAGSGRRPGYVR